jgi:hypothetical protein
MLSDFAGRPLAPRGVKAASDSPEEVKRAKRALLRRAKRSERDFAKWLILHDGPDPKYKHMTTSTGRIGHINQIRADCLSMTYLGENKNEKVPAKLAGWWQLICEKAIEWGKDPVLRWEAPNASDYKVAGKPLPDMHIITAERHAELLLKEKWYDERN